MPRNKDTSKWTVRGGYIQVSGRIDGKRHRYTTSKPATAQNETWIRNNHMKILLKIIEEKSGISKTEATNDLKEFAHQYLDLTSGNRNEQQQRDSKSSIDNIIAPHFPNFKIEHLTTDNIKKWQNSLLKKYSTTYVNRLTRLLSRVLHQAVGKDIISKNPCDYLDVIKVEHEKEIPYTLEETKLIMKKTTGWLNVYVSLAFTSGLRPSELIGLRKEDIDLDGNSINLCRAISKGKIRKTSTTKNHSRVITIPDFIAAKLKDYLDTFESEWVFPSTRGNRAWYDARGVLEHFKVFLDTIDVPYKKLKTTRHTYISLLRNTGVSSDLVIENVGHSKIVSDKHYFTQEKNEKKTKTFNNVFIDLGMQKKKA